MKTAYRSGKKATPVLPFNVAEMHMMFTGLPVPDPITFITSPQWLNQPSLFPRQGTLVKLIMLRPDLLTEFDHQVIDEWEEEMRQTSRGGLVPDIRGRMRTLKAAGHPWFTEIILVLGRRAGKGVLVSLCMAYVLWNYMAKGNPQGYYNLMEGRRFTAMIFAGKMEQAKSLIFADLTNVLDNAPCFNKYIDKRLDKKWTIYAPYDFVRMEKNRAEGKPTDDMATFEIIPKEATGIGTRGYSTFMIAMDEMAFVTKATAKSDAKEVYDGAKPALDQFKKDAFLAQPSSPWSQEGQFYENWKQAMATDDEGKPLRHSFFGIQLASWRTYEGYRDAHNIPMFPPGFMGDLDEYVDVTPGNFRFQKSAPQELTEELLEEKRLNPEVFSVEREAQWAAVMAAYLDPDVVDKAAQPWQGRLEGNGMSLLNNFAPPRLDRAYYAHFDPASVNDRFGIAVGHMEEDDDNNEHAVFDVVHYFDPKVPGPHILEHEEGKKPKLDYEYITQWLWDNVIKVYAPHTTMDQFNGVALSQRLQKMANNANLHTRVTVTQEPVTAPNDWKVKEQAKMALNLGRVHFPQDDELLLEMKHLQVAHGKRVDHPSTGPVKSKDIADALFVVISKIIGDGTSRLVHGQLENLQPRGGDLDRVTADRFRAMSGLTGGYKSSFMG